MQADEAGARLQQPGLQGRRRRRGEAEGPGDGRPGDAGDERRPVLGLAGPPGGPRGRLHECEGAVADHRLAVPRGVAGVAQVERDHLQPEPPPLVEQPGERGAPAGLLGAEPVGVEGEDLRRGELVEILGRGVGQVVGEVGRDHHQGLWAAPEGRQHLGHVARRGSPHREGDQREGAERLLQEGELHLQRVLQGVGGGAPRHLGQAQGDPDRLLVDRHPAERGEEAPGLGERQADHRHVVGRPQQHHPLDPRARGAQLGVGDRRGRPGVDVAGVRDHQRLGAPVDAQRGGREQPGQGGPQRGRLAGVEGPGHRGRPYRRQMCAGPAHVWMVTTIRREAEPRLDRTPSGLLLEGPS